MALPPGARLGELEILRVLAVGGFGIVYVARDHSLDRDVAVKEFMPGQLAGRIGGDRVMVRSGAHADIYAAGLCSFIDEAKLLARFSHPAMVKVYRIREANGTAYMVMPYLRGPTLSDLRRSMSEPPTEGWLRRVVDPLLDALAMLHEEGIYHRDISPDNVLMADGAPVLLDFGAARRLIGDRTQPLTAILKPRYAPIEQYAEAKQLRQGPWTDLYALAALLAYLLNGEPPPASTARAIHDEMAPLAGQRIPGVSSTMLSAIDWALAVRPRDRPQNVAEFRRALNGGPATPAVSRMRLSKTPARDGKPPDDAPAGPFTATVAQDRSDVSVAADGAPGWLKARGVERPWRLAVGGVLVALAVGWPIAREVSAPSASVGAGPLAPTSTAVSSEAPKRSLPAMPAGDASVPAPPAAADSIASKDAKRADTAASIDVPAAGPFAAALAASASLAATPEPPPAPATRRVASHGAPTTDRSRRPAQTGPSARNLKIAALQARSPGPVEMCAGHNFFARPYCVQRQCDAPRFKHHAYCLQLRQVAQYRRDQLP